MPAVHARPDRNRFWRNTRLEKHFPDGDPPAPPPSRVTGSCPVCHSEITVEGGAIHGGDPSGHYTELRNKAESADEWRTKFEQYRTEHPDTPPAPVPDPAAPPAEEVEYFL